MAVSVAYAVTGDLMLSVTLSLLEPTVQAVAFFFHEKAWERVGRTPRITSDSPRALRRPWGWRGKCC